MGEVVFNKKPKDIKAKPNKDTKPAKKVDEKISEDDVINVLKTFKLNNVMIENILKMDTDTLTLNNVKSTLDLSKLPEEWVRKDENSILNGVKKWLEDKRNDWTIKLDKDRTLVAKLKKFYLDNKDKPIRILQYLCYGWMIAFLGILRFSEEEIDDSIAHFISFLAMGAVIGLIVMWIDKDQSLLCCDKRKRKR